MHGRPTPSRPALALTDAALRSACWRGDIPAEALSTEDREQLVYDLWAARWTDAEIATRTQMTTYTTARIRARLGLVPRSAQKGAA